MKQSATALLICLLLPTPFIAAPNAPKPLFDQYLENTYIHPSGNWGIGVNESDGYFMLFERERPGGKYVTTSNGFGLFAGYSLPTTDKRLAYKIIRQQQANNTIQLEAEVLIEGKRKTYLVNAYHTDKGGLIKFSAGISD